MKTEGVVDLLELIRREFQGRAQLGVLRIRERHDGVEAIVAAGELNDNEDRIFGARLPSRWCRECRPSEESRHADAPGNQAAGFQKIASGREHWSLLIRVASNLTETPAMLTPSGTPSARGGPPRPRRSSIPVRAASWHFACIREVCSGF